MRNGRMARKAIACGALVAVALASTASGATLRRRANVAASWVVSQQRDNGSFLAFSKVGSTADGILALAAAKRGPKSITKAVKYLRRKANEVAGSPNAIDTIGEKAKVVMALEAVGRNPRDFEGRNLVHEIRMARGDDGSYSDVTFQEVIDQALALIALEATDAPIPLVSWQWLVDAQCPDGGWQFDRPYDDQTDDEHCFNSGQFDAMADTNTTGYAVQALSLQNEVEAANPFPFFRSARDGFKKGWVYEPERRCEVLDGSFCYLTDTNSTSLTIQAYLAAGRDVPQGGMKALKRLQYRLCGNDGGAFGFSWVQTDSGLEKDDPNLGATTQAVPALRKKPFPLNPVEVTKPVPDVDPC